MQTVVPDFSLSQILHPSICLFLSLHIFIHFIIL